MPVMDFVSPLVNGLSRLIKSEDYPLLSELYDNEEKILIRELISAQDDKDLRVIQGKAKMLKKLRTLPEETVDRYLNEKKRGQK